MLVTPRIRAGLSLLEVDTEHEAVAMDASSRALEELAGPSMESSTGSSTSPWNRPKVTVRQKTYNISGY